MPKHTPGPWVVRAESALNTPSPRMVEVWCRVSPGLSKRVASVRDESTARLIAAAPELLSALKGMRAYYTGGRINNPAQTVAAAAIAKAEGEKGHVCYPPNYPDCCEPAAEGE